MGGNITDPTIHSLAKTQAANRAAGPWRLPNKGAVVLAGPTEKFQDKYQLPLWIPQRPGGPG
jgi:hypothetical protein